jgi:hypothetical protein
MRSFLTDRFWRKAAIEQPSASCSTRLSDRQQVAKVLRVIRRFTSGAAVMRLPHNSAQ